MKRLIFAVTMICAIAATPPVFADDSGFYAGIGGGVGKFSDTVCDAGEASGVTVTVNECEDETTAWRALLGYQFNAYFGVEFGAAFSYGYEVGITTSSQGTSESDVQELDFNTLDLSAVVSYPLNDAFSVFLRGGVHSWQLGDTDFLIISTSDYEEGSDPLIGSGLEYRPGETLGARLEYTRYKVDDEDLDMLTLQLVIGYL